MHGYDADHSSYFFRVYVPDKSVQLGFSAGCSWYDATLVRPEDFRNGLNISPAANHLHVGAMGEKGFFNMRITITSGVYYSQVNSYLLGWPGYKGAVYVVDSEDAQTVRYTSVSDVRSVTSCVSIPVEFTYLLYRQPDMGVYLKGGLMANFNVHAGTKFSATSYDTSEEVKQRLTSYFTDSETFSADAYARLGIRWGDFDSPNFRLEVGIPFMLSESSGLYYRTKLGITAQIGLYIPLFIFYL